MRHLRKVPPIFLKKRSLLTTLVLWPHSLVGSPSFYLFRKILATFGSRDELGGDRLYPSIPLWTGPIQAF